MTISRVQTISALLSFFFFTKVSARRPHCLRLQDCRHPGFARRIKSGVGERGGKARLLAEGETRASVTATPRPMPAHSSAPSLESRAGCFSAMQSAPLLSGITPGTVNWKPLVHCNPGTAMKRLHLWRLLADGNAPTQHKTQAEHAASIFLWPRSVLGRYGYARAASGRGESD